MLTKNKKIHSNTNDQVIREALLYRLQDLQSEGYNFRIIEELGINHGECRADIAVVNGVMHGFEIKSDLDNLLRLPEQIKAYNGVFDKVTIVVGYSHLLEVMHMIPDWWGVMLAVSDDNHKLSIHTIRDPERNKKLDYTSIARLLWKDEALYILEEMNAQKGVKSKPRNAIYERLINTVSQDLLQEKVRETLCLRTNWRVDQQLQLSGG